MSSRVMIVGRTFLPSLYRVRARHHPILKRCLSISSTRSATGDNQSYLQGDLSSHQAQRNNENSPIYVVSNPSPEGSGPFRLMNRVRILWFMIGSLAFPVLLWWCGPFWLPILDRMRGNAIQNPRLRTRLPDPAPQQAEAKHDPADATAAYAEDDGTEISRSAATQSQNLPSAQVLALEKDVILQKLWNLRESVDSNDTARHNQDLLNSANASQLRTHMLLLELVTGSHSDRAILDNALLESRPIFLPDETRVDTEKASLIRILDAKGKNRVIILGVDLDWHESNQEVASRFPSDRYELDTWLIDLANELERKGDNAPDLCIYLYSNRVIVDVSHINGSSWMTRYRQADFPPGFPLTQLRQVKRISDPNANISNAVHNVSKASKGKDTS